MIGLSVGRRQRTPGIGTTSTRRALAPLFLALCLLFAFASCEAHSGRELEDGLGRTWKLNADYDTGSKYLQVNAKMDGQPGEKMTIVQFNSAGNQCAETITSTTGAWAGTLSANATSVTILCEAGSAGVAVHESLAE